MTGRLDEVMKYIELNKTSNNNNDMDEALIKKIEQLLKELEKPRNKPSKEQVLEQLERMFSELEEGKITYSPSVRDRFEIEDL